MMFTVENPCNYKTLDFKPWAWPGGEPARLAINHPDVLDGPDFPPEPGLDTRPSRPRSPPEWR